MTSEDTIGTDRAPARHAEDTIGAIRSALAKLRFGAIQLTVHEGRLVQMDVTEKRRFPA
jgi:hypothetical protein